MKPTHIKVLAVAGMVETTVIVCSECGQELSNPKIET
jgi:hypothetical protein